MQRKVARKGVNIDNVILFPNWVDSDIVYSVSKSASARNEWGFDDHHRIVLYAGNLGEKQGLENVLVVADRLREEPNLTFVIVGEGGAKARLMEEAERLQLPNLVFKPLQPLDRLAASLAAADIHLVLQKKAAADLVMPSKLTNILAVGGHALVTAEEGTTLHELVHAHHLGTLVAPEDAGALERGIREILAGQRADDARGARQFAAEHLDKRSILFGFRTVLDSNTKRHST
jgi:colanic acid biosynthesis glycosyl transferase WcaI